MAICSHCGHDNPDLIERAEVEERMRLVREQAEKILSDQRMMKAAQRDLIAAARVLVQMEREDLGLTGGEHKPQRGRRGRHSSHGIGGGW